MKKLWWAWMAVAVSMATGCGGVETDEETPLGLDEEGAVHEEGSVDEALSTAAPSFVRIRRDVRKCAYPFCGGYFVRDVNRSTAEQYVYALSFGLSGLDGATRGLVTESDAQDDIVLKGRLSPKSSKGVSRFIVYEAYRGMPGITPAADAKLYAVTERLIQCFAAPCDVYRASPLNQKYARPTDFAEVDVITSLMPFVDAEWLTHRVVSGRALVAGVWLEKAYESKDGPGMPVKTLDASQVYVRLPEVAGPCPLYPIAPPPEGTVVQWDRNAERCLIPAGYTTPGVCPMYFPQCAEGYEQVSWSGEGGCAQYACDPSFASSP